MSKTIPGVYRNGRIELLKEPFECRPDGRVLVTFLEPGEIDLAEYGISEEQAALLRSQLGTFAEDWDSPEMSIYDDYDRARTSL